VVSTHWLQRRTRYWRRLDELVTRARASGFSALNANELRELGQLYRQVASDLATVREDPGSIRIETHLNLLLARAHNTIYSADRSSATGVAAFLREGFPRAVRAHARHILVAALLFGLAAAVGAALTAQDPDFTVKVVGPEMADTIRRHEMWTHSIVGVKPAASSAIMTNNMTVAFTTFALGITAGLGTVYMLLFNGLLIGVIGMACGLSGMSVALWSFVAPHGVIELPAIFIAGGAGLRLAEGLLFPGTWPRRDSLARAGREAVTLVLGCVPLLVIAGLIEAFVSPTDLPVALKFAMAAAIAVLFAGYLLPRRQPAGGPLRQSANGSTRGSAA
jgi:uncharacterized membrane protein SpoIIM required for sporulation